MLGDLFVSTGCIIFTISLSQFLRELSRDKLSPKNKLAGILVLEFIATFELTAVAYELSIVFGIGGISFFAIFLFGIWYWRTQNWHGVAGSPSKFLQNFIESEVNLPTVLLGIIAQLAGGSIAYRYYNTLYWNLGLSHGHAQRAHDGFDSECFSDIKILPFHAALVECFIVFIYVLLGNLVGRVKYLNGVRGILDAFVGTCVVLLALDLSGGYLNPVLASTMQYGCSGSTLLEHFQVYWVADTFGALAAYYADKFLAWGGGKLYSNTIGKLLSQNIKSAQKTD